MTQHVMLDLETWGTEPGCDLRSIGACVFYPDTTNAPTMYSERTFYAATDNPVGIWRNGDFEPGVVIRGERRKYLTLHRSAATVKWWSEQSEEVQAAFADPVDLRDGLVRFTNWIAAVTQFDRDCDVKQNPNLRLWVKGPHFDIAILAAVYGALGMLVPWSYRAPRDTRTIVDAAGITYEEEKAMFTGTPHHALDDAVSQAKVVCEAYKRLGLVK